MADDSPFKLIDLSTGKIITPISDAEVQALKKYFEQESPSDTSFYITPEAIQFLRSRGADTVADLLAAVLSDSHGKAVGYAPARNIGSYRVRGRVLALETNTPLTGYKIEIFDEDIVFDDLLGWCYSDLQGKFELRFDESDYKDLAPPDVEGKPEVKLRISDVDGTEIGWVGILREVEADFGDIFIAATGKLIAPVLDPVAAAICPLCGALYRSGFSTCSDCQVSLRPLADRV
jgi:hypothetical protein